MYLSADLFRIYADQKIPKKIYIRLRTFFKYLIESIVASDAVLWE